MRFARIVEWTGWTMIATTVVGGTYIATETFVGERVAAIVALAVLGFILVMAGTSTVENEHPEDEAVESGDSP